MTHTQIGLSALNALATVDFGSCTGSTCWQRQKGWQMAHRAITTPDELADLTRLLGNLKLPITVEWTQGRDRSRDQNALQWLWATEAARQLGDQTAEEVQREWKLRHGVPILRAHSSEFREVYDTAIRPLPYELKLEAMRFIPVTSGMKVPQMVEYLDTIQREAGGMGIRLTDPDPDLAKYQARYRVALAAGI